jgi:L-ascorbate metabolism protein UlaG (beta-lactamase superfamily)
MDDGELTATAGERLRLTWLGHSTVVLELHGLRLITDPVLRSRVAHLRRVVSLPDGRTLANLDAALVSHVHYDHLDRPSLRQLDRSVPVFVPAGADGLVRRLGFSRVVEVEVGDELSLGPVTIRVTFAEHDGRRGPFGTSAAAVGYVVAGSKSVYFAGDTDLFDGMDGLAPDVDVALLPIAGWGPRVPAGHLDPARAAEALVRLRPRIAVPIHWGTYRRIGLDRDPDVLQAPAESFARFARELAPNVDVRVLPVGGTLTLSRVEAPVRS